MVFALKSLKYCAAGVFAAIVLSGCASVKNRTGDAEPLAASGTGYVFASVMARNESSDPELKLGQIALVNAFFHPVDEPKKVEFVVMNDLNPDMKRAKLESGGGFRTFVLLAVKPGKYKLGKVIGSMTAYRKEISREMVDMPEIEVREGQVSYVGSVRIITGVGKGWLFGQALPASAGISVVDDYAQDLMAIKTLDTRLNTFKFSNGLTGKVR
ncbi:hypothetical protein GTP46_17775 [Duganella sp. FT135W]|uniref:Type VI secretion system lipoprotein TssJ n=1 Tax=Duganella flavida TaxID=2692175 RepID=A0A6L8KAW2_9BURK|nr:hypothetical protein [Duganella flavida]MYM24496.1 hypothetical protein [Duganella flavida]